MSDVEHISSTTDADFIKDVIEPSKSVPVLVDFWAPWCGPCKNLMPVIERLVKAEDGAVKLVKVNVDDEKGIAGQLRVMGIPAVFAFKDGKPVDMFKGGLPESAVKAFIDKQLGRAALV
ncbi:MAG: thioredoxin [Acidimicrobiales bacterium]|nr:thioredoxin [Hyphomonadaceae bacterium]RZV45101.1 MAG: thioredoxin [Acidimicrobiales bacterium]